MSRHGYAYCMFHLGGPVTFCFFVYQVLSSYQEEGFSFLMKVFNVPSYLEDLTGLTQLLQDTRVSEVSKICSFVVNEASLLFNNYSLSARRYEMAHNHFVSNKREWNNSFIKNCPKI